MPTPLTQVQIKARMIMFERAVDHLTSVTKVLHFTEPHQETQGLIAANQIRAMAKKWHSRQKDHKVGKAIHDPRGPFPR